MVSTLDDILKDYNTYKPKLEPGGDCDDAASTMFTTLRSVSQSELRTLKGSNSDYATLLSTPAGIAFERDVGSADIINLYASLLAPPASSEKPMNKYLADIEFCADLQEDAISWNNPLISYLSVVAINPKMYIACRSYRSRLGLLVRAHLTYLGVAYFNSKFWAGWPPIVSDADKEHARQKYRFVEYSTP